MAHNTSLPIQGRVDLCALIETGHYSLDLNRILIGFNWVDPRFAVTTGAAFKPKSPLSASCGHLRKINNLCSRIAIPPDNGSASSRI
jgi:hypothetical protein